MSASAPCCAHRRTARSLRRPGRPLQHQPEPAPIDAVQSGTDIAPVTLLAVTPLVLMVHPSVPATNLQELLAWLRAQRQATYASQAVGSTGHLAISSSSRSTGVEGDRCRDKGSAAQAATDLVAGRVAMSFVNTSTTIAYLQRGTLRAVAVAEKRRIAALPDIATLDESGLPGFEARRGSGSARRPARPRCGAPAGAGRDSRVGPARERAPAGRLGHRAAADVAAGIRRLRPPRHRALGRGDPPLWCNRRVGAELEGF